MTAVEWFADKIDDIINDGLRERIELLKEEAKQMEKEQRINAQIDMFHHLNDMPYGMQYLDKRDSAEQFCETYGSKGSDEIKKAEEMGLYDKIELANPNDSIFTSSQTEISDEEIAIGRFMNWFLKHYSTATIDGFFGYVNAMGQEVRIQDILKDYRKLNGIENN